MDSKPSPTLIDVDGWPAWLYADGRIRPHVRGGEGDDPKDPADPPADPPKNDDPPADPPKDDGKPGPVSFTPEQQAHIDSLIAKSHGKAKSQAEKEFKTWLEQQGLSETERHKAEKEAADKRAVEAEQGALVARVETTAERLALAAGVKPDRVEKFMRLVDLKNLDDLTADGKPDRDAIKALVEAELADAPEFKGGKTSGKSGAEFDGDGKKVWTRAEVAKLSPDEYDKHEAEILAQLTAGGIK